MLVDGRPFSNASRQYKRDESSRATSEQWTLMKSNGDADDESDRLIQWCKIKRILSNLIRSLVSQQYGRIVVCSYVCVCVVASHCSRHLLCRSMSHCFFSTRNSSSSHHLHILVCKSVAYDTFHFVLEHFEIMMQQHTPARSVGELWVWVYHTA